MTTQEQNKLIAEFMDYEVVRIGYYDCHNGDEWDETEWQVTNRGWIDRMNINLIGDYIANVSENKIHELEAVKYHSDWSWLMPVVEKIEQGNYGFKMCRKVVEVYFDDTKAVIFKVKEKSRIESLYVAVIKFIQWYNQQNTSKHGTE